MSSPISQEAQNILDGEWPRLPAMDYSDPMLIGPVREAVNEGYKAISETGSQQCTIVKDNISDVACSWISPQNILNEDIILNLPGGGGIFGSPETHFSIAIAVASAANCRILSVDYPKAPEHPYPEPQDSIEKLYQALMINEKPPTVHILADSFGASLAINLILRLRKQNSPLPKSIEFICPFVDFNYEGDSSQALCGIDPSWDNHDVIKLMTDAHIGKASCTDPMLSVLNADFYGFPPTFIQAASKDLILSDSIRLQRKLRSAGNHVEFDLWEGLWHDFQAYQSIPEAREATDAVADFIKRQINS